MISIWRKKTGVRHQMSGIVFIATDSKQVIASIDKDMGDTGFLRLDKEARPFMSERLTNTE